MLIFYILLGLLLTFITILVIKAIHCKAVARRLAPEKSYATQSEEEQHLVQLASMIACKTISVKDSYDDTEFKKLRNVVERLFPLFHQKAEKMIFSDDCWIYKIVGKDTSRNIMLMSHHDVVEANGIWNHDPFGGEVAQGVIWGRGTIDTKTPLYAEFAAIESLLQEGYVPPCNLYLGSSHNEELGGDGIPKALAYFEAEQIKFELILDEGGAIIDPPIAGISCNCAMLAVHEKGRHKLICTANKEMHQTGLVANPQTPVVRISAFITAVSNKNRFIRRMHPQVKAMFEGLAPYMGFPMRLLFANLWCFSPLLCLLIPKLNAQAGSMLGTLCTFAEIKSDAQNKQCVTTAFLRCVDDQDLATDIQTLTTLATKFGITVEDAPTGNEFHKSADFTSPQFAYVQHCVETVFPHICTTPFILPAGTDARHFSDICPNVIRFAPIRIDDKQFKTVHSANENIGVKAVSDAVAFYRHLLANYQ